MGGDDGGATLRVAFWNAWLLAPRVSTRGPRLPGGQQFFAPDVDERAPLVAEAVKGRFDVVALSEVFERSEQWAVQASWPRAHARKGPERSSVGRTGSGLLTLVDPVVAVVGSAVHTYAERGDARDSDWFSSKGALLVHVRTGPDGTGPGLDVVSTHLLAGGDLLPLPGADDRTRHHTARMAQVDELVAFVERERDPAAALVVAGDFNVPAHLPGRSGDAATAEYDDLRSRLEPLGLVDVWATSGVGAGNSCTFVDAAELPADPDEPDCVLDAPSDSVDGPGERIDYLWLGQPAEGSVRATADRPRRWAFPGRPVTGGPAGSLSDHLLLSTTVHLAPA